jgi:hypothetical protein
VQQDAAGQVQPHEDRADGVDGQVAGVDRVASEVVGQRLLEAFQAVLVLGLAHGRVARVAQHDGVHLLPLEDRQGLVLPHLHQRRGGLEQPAGDPLAERIGNADVEDVRDRPGGGALEHVVAQAVGDAQVEVTLEGQFHRRAPAMRVGARFGYNGGRHPIR